MKQRTVTNSVARILGSLALACAPVALMACEQNDAEDIIEDSADAIEDAGDEAADAIDDATDEIDDP